jgi:thiamine kinase-like enzyme
MPEAPLDPERGLADEGGLRALLQRCEATRRLADGRLTTLEGGLSNRAWRLDAAGEAWFVRRGHPHALRLGVDRHSECAVLRTVAAAGLAPELLACEPELGLLVTRYIEGRPWQAADVLAGSNLERVARQLRQLHDLPVPYGIRPLAYGRQARHLLAGLPARDPGMDRLCSLAGPVFTRIEQRRPRTVLCHHDLHHLNILDDGGLLWLVDWEYAARGDPLLDVAGFLAMHELGPAPTAAFVAAYGRLGPADVATLDDARWAFDYVQWLWYRSRFPGAMGPEGRHAERLAQRLLRCNN